LQGECVTIIAQACNIRSGLQSNPAEYFMENQMEKEYVAVTYTVGFEKGG
jgi:hypothetical protein